MSKQKTPPAITPELKSAVTTYLLALAYERTIRPTVERYQREILVEMAIPVAAEWIEMKAEHAGLITDPKQIYLAEDADACRYFEALDVAKEAAGFAGLPEGYCPLLIAENQTRLAARQVVDASVYMTGKSFTWHELLCSGLDNYQQYVDLTVSLVVRLCPDITAQSAMASLQERT